MKFLLQFTLLVLGFTALTGLIGGALLLVDTTGGLLNLSYNFLSGSPFSSFFWPGVLLFVVIGCGGVLACINTYKRRPNFTKVIYTYAVVLLLFTIGQVYITDAYTTFNSIYILFALLLILLGWLINSQKHLQHAAPSSTATHHMPKKAHHHSKRHRNR